MRRQKIVKVGFPEIKEHILPDFEKHKPTKLTANFFFLSFLIPLLCLEYIVTFTKVLTIYHS
jgi:hypothetical protein